MASSAPSTPRRRFSSQDADIIDEPSDSLTTLSSGGGNRSRLNSSAIPRTYSGLYGAGAPPVPDIVVDTDNGSDAAADNNNNTTIQSPPRVKSSVHAASKTRHVHHQEQQSNLLPFELSHNRNTDWIATGGPALLVTYISIILIFLLTFLAFVTEPKVAWTLTNVAHGLVSLVYLHWIKGNPADYMDGTQGEMNAMTCWEQIVCKPAIHYNLHDDNSKQKILTAQSSSSSSSPSRSIRESMTVAIKKLRSRDVLCVIPTLLAHASCHVAKYEFEYVVINVGLWAVIMLPKMPFMNGVRILGINRTAGIDDGEYNLDDDYQGVGEGDTEEETSRESNNDVGLDVDVDDEVDSNVEKKKDR